jgi:hypothetical protein
LKLLKINQTLPIETTTPKTQKRSSFHLHVVLELETCQDSFPFQDLIFDDDNLPFEPETLPFTDILKKFSNFSSMKIQGKSHFFGRTLKKLNNQTL